ncbi:hypothetical protein Tdes44962_MAKER07876 [Teratosphaeria destructans]|uniref:Uncharacterized protein n=1 Tax=Teratosphaeria destructans TaxID=418781 RepID=A0A9W7SY68_9PEZI|nr:hypothetical protein Tdes44962_MAKER07876 [Teratosphaeria destructans]
MPTFEELYASLTALIAQYEDLRDCYCQVGQQYHSIPMTLRTGPEASRVPGHCDAAFIFRPDERLKFRRAENIVQGFGFCGQKIQTAFEFLQRGDLQTAAQGLYWKIPEYLDALSRVVESLESNISARVQAARMKEARLGRRRMTAQAWDYEMMKEREMAEEAAGQQAQWQTAVSDAERYVRGVEEQMRFEEAVRQEQRKKSLDMLMGRPDEIIRAFEEGTATQGDSVVAKGSAMPVFDAQGRERAVEVVQTAGPFVLDEEGRRKTGKAVYQLRKSIRKRERKEQEERERIVAMGSAED